MAFVLIVSAITVVLVGTALIPRFIKIRQAAARRRAPDATETVDPGPTTTMPIGTDLFRARVIVAKLNSRGIPASLMEGTRPPEAILSYFVRDETAVIEALDQSAS